MATIKYIFADGHTEEVEVTEEFKREYEFLLVREQAPHWKEMKQKERAGLRCVKKPILWTVTGLSFCPIFSERRKRNPRKCEVPMNVKVNGLTLHVEPDYNPPHPRTECDHLGKMLCWHRNYAFGDQNRYDTPEEFYRSEEAKNIYVSLPVYMLDHSGTFLSTRGFADVDPDRWDWGQIGIIYCTEEAAKKWFGYLPDKEMLKTQLNGEVECYNDYLNGAWYEYFIEGRDGEIEDSCGGFFQGGDFSYVLKDMKEYTERNYHPLFDKLAAKLESKNYM